jgi:hypothetical protein
MTANQKSLDSFDSEDEDRGERGSIVEMPGLRRVNRTPLAFLAALGTLRLLSKQYDSRVKLRWEREGYSYVPQVKVEEHGDLTREEVLDRVKSELYDSSSGSKLLYEKTGGKVNDGKPLLNTNGNSRIVIEENDDGGDSEINSERIVENRDGELVRVLSGFLAEVPGDSENEERGVSITDLKFAAAGQATLNRTIPKYTTRKSLKEKLEGVSGVGSSTAESIINETGVESREDIENLTVDDLEEVDGVGRSTAEEINQEFESGRLELALFGQWKYEYEWKNEDLTVLRLDPYETQGGRTVIGANILAVEAFPLFTVVPREDAETVCLINERSGDTVGYLRYPIWNKWMCIEEVRYVLSHPELRSSNPDVEELNYVERIYEAEKVCGDEDCRYKDISQPDVV